MSFWWGSLGLLVALQQAPSLGTPVQAPLVLEMPVAKTGAWQAFFVDHRPTPEGLASVAPLALQAASTAQAAYDRGDYISAYRAAEDSLRAAPDFPPSLLLLGTAAFRLRRHGDTKAALGRFLEVAPGELWRTQALGHALYSLGEYERARAHYGNVLEVFPKSTEGRRGLALALLRLGEYAAAAAELERLVAATPGSAPAWAWLAQVRFDMDELEASLKAAQRASELDAFDPRAHYIASRVLFELGQDVQARAAEKQWVELSESHARIDSLKNRLLFASSEIGLHFALASEYARLGDVAHLKSVTARLLAQAAEPGELLERGLGVLELLSQAGAEPEAKKLIVKLAELYPDDARVLALSARILGAK